MSRGISYTLGKTWSRIPRAGKIALALGALFLVVRCASSGGDEPAAAQTPPPAPYGFSPTVPTDPERVAAGRKALVEKCGAEAAAMQAQYKKLFAAKDFLGAKGVLGVCPGIMDDLKLAKQAADAEAAHQVAVDAAAKKVAAAEKAAKKKAGVSIGMTEADVLASSWGKPEKINRSTNKYGTREQWVYGGGNYLYLEDGKVSAIQN